MLEGRKIVVVMPAYNAARTLKKTYDEVPKDIVDEILLVDDGSHDETIELSKRLGIKTFIHERNFGYGRNQKTCYREALKTGADIVVMLHPDYQYSPKLITAMASLIAADEYDVVIASRILGVGAVKGGMPIYKYISNRFLTFFENLLLFYKLSEYHTGYRAFSKRVLESLPLMENSDDFVFDNEMLAQVIFWRYKIGEISCPTKYFPEASSINFTRSTKYGIGCLLTSLKFRLQRMRLGKFRIFSDSGRKLFEDSYYRMAEPEAVQQPKGY
ncbi:MAG: glycosyltransferase family 2 protein [Candidatus Abyssobacteria bacterium SURF_17]|uniref:Glycosyltransferase family 2 protein n=1 Tax=Candidatus Abyssobacteria bacterium SURF_17 TaxID=2093361 RepID=A0A419ENR9_9BACT|nr:MAG: glycosyltransferase family 2 protein [Candidatus Abyssubacteria bacterium SURF_17]